MLSRPMAEGLQLGAVPDERRPSENSSAETKTSGWRRWFGKSDAVLPADSPSLGPPQRPGVARRLSRKVIPGLQRPGTFKRQQSELRDKLEEVQPNKHLSSRTLSSRTRSVDHHGQSRSPSSSNIPKLLSPRLSAPGNLGTIHDTPATSMLASPVASIDHQNQKSLTYVSEEQKGADPSQGDAHSISVDGFDDELLEELEKRWILNLSMHFRDRSNREKFFVTFAETPALWRRITISLDYRDAHPASLESELQQMQFQRDKSARIYESIRDSLPDIQFYGTVTNLKLQTENERLHVHVTEDVHEVINFPSVTAISHLSRITCPQYREQDLLFDSHLSGFVYKVNINGQVYIKKEIPGPDTVEEFLYEINALHRLIGSGSVIEFRGVVTDNESKYLKGLLISYAEKGALIDVIYDGNKTIRWARRQRWAKQIVQGLSEIHEAGFVQGDFTLSNIVIDADDNAKIIDINRRGCPVGWEPSEIVKLLKSKQRISMFISTKTDLFQLGMVLWALAMQLDEPELESRPLTLNEAHDDDVPKYFREIVSICLSDDPRKRQQATCLLSRFPDVMISKASVQHEETVKDHNFETRHVSPGTATERVDINNARLLASQPNGTNFTDIDSTTMHTYANISADVSGEPYLTCSRGRPPGTKLRGQEISPPHSIEEDVLNSSHRQTPVLDEGNLPIIAQSAEHIDRGSDIAFPAVSEAAEDGFSARVKPVDKQFVLEKSTENRHRLIVTPRETGVVDIPDTTTDLAGIIELHSIDQRYPQALGDDDMN